MRPRTYNPYLFSNRGSEDEVTDASTRDALQKHYGQSALFATSGGDLNSIGSYPLMSRLNSNAYPLTRQMTTQPQILDALGITSKLTPASPILYEDQHLHCSVATPPKTQERRRVNLAAQLERKKLSESRADLTRRQLLEATSEANRQRKESFGRGKPLNQIKGRSNGAKTSVL